MISTSRVIGSAQSRIATVIVAYIGKTGIDCLPVFAQVR
jgi:hypothetical protein